MDERVEFIVLYRRGEYSMSALCREFGISRKTGYKYVQRYHDMGTEGLPALSGTLVQCQDIGYTCAGT